MIRTGCVVAILWLSASFLQPESEDLRAKGQSLYSSLCQRCHGETGDDTGYPGITPLSGITLRIPAHEIPTLSAPFVGRTFEGKEAEVLIDHLETLKGEKGFDQPGYLFSPYLLEKKHSETSHYRIIDTRQASEYEAGHIPNAVLWKPTASADDTRKQLAALGVAGPETFVVVYDGNGGLRAAAAWWSIRKAGHERVAVLDGGFLNWTSQAYPVSRSASVFALSSYPRPTTPTGSELAPCQELEEKILVLGETSGSEGLRFDWRKTRSENGLLPASDVRAFLDSMGIGVSGRYHLKGDPRESAYLIFLLHLLGESPQVSSTGDTVCLPPQNQAY